MSNNTNAVNSEINVRVVSTIEDMIACHRIRSACFMSGEMPSEYADEFDGNDFSAATHLLAFQNGSPVGTMRIRILNGNFGADGAEGAWERLCVLPGKRGSMAILNALAQTAIKYSTMKGISTIRGLVSDPRVAKLWKKKFKGVFTNDPPVMMDNHEYRYIVIDLRPYRVAVEPIHLLEIEPDGFERRVTGTEARKQAA